MFLRFYLRKMKNNFIFDQFWNSRELTQQESFKLRSFEIPTNSFQVSRFPENIFKKNSPRSTFSNSRTPPPVFRSVSYDETDRIGITRKSLGKRQVIKQRAILTIFPSGRDANGWSWENWCSQLEFFFTFNKMKIRRERNCVEAGQIFQLNTYMERFRAMEINFTRYLLLCVGTTLLSVDAVLR